MLRRGASPKAKERAEEMDAHNAKMKTKKQQLAAAKKEKEAAKKAAKEKKAQDAKEKKAAKKEQQAIDREAERAMHAHEGIEEAVDADVDRGCV